VVDNADDAGVLSARACDSQKWQAGNNGGADGVDVDGVDVDGVDVDGVDVDGVDVDGVDVDGGEKRGAR